MKNSNMKWFMADNTSLRIVIFLNEGLIFIARPNDDAEKNCVKDKNLSWSGIRMVLYHVNHSWPDIANLTWDFLKVIGGANQASFLEMHQILLYPLLEVIDCSWNQKEPSDIACFSNNEYIGNLVTRRCTLKKNMFIAKDEEKFSQMTSRKIGWDLIY